MNTVASTSTLNTKSSSSASRVVSIDIFRGLTMAVMIFVNALSDVRGLPWWTYHAPARLDEMTYVDMVFPFFLFIVGMSFPLSIRQRLKNNPSVPMLWVHVIVRSLALVVLGLILANAEKCDPALMGLSGSTWAILGLICAGLYLNIYPKSIRFPSYARVLQLIGLGGVIVLLAIFRRTAEDGRPAWIDFSYPEILGLIGITYFAVAILYLPTRRFKWAPVIWFVLLVILNVLSSGKMIAFPDHLSLYVWPFGNGAMACIMMAGVATSWLFLGDAKGQKTYRILAIAASIGILALVAGYVLTPFGISKIRATPTWSLYSIGAAILCFTIFYWICDIRHWHSWAFLVHPAGSNTLTTYLLPDLWYFLSVSLGFTFLDTHFATGAPAVLKTVVFTLAILAFAALLTRLKVRLRL